MRTPQPGRPLLHFEGQMLPYRLWQHAGLDLASYPNPWGCLNGYVRLPEDHPQLSYAMTGELNSPVRESFRPNAEGRYERHEPGYHFIEPVQAPGGWTYGPDEEGWIGFDTAHAGDVWDPVVARDMLRRFSLMEAQRTENYVGLIDEYFPFVPSGYGWDRYWTPGRLVAELERIAEEFAAQTQAHPVESVYH